MCGIVGILNKSGRPVDREILQKMNRCLVHRGPDDEGYFVEGPLGLGHRRLSIIDLKGGHQPMTTSDGRYTIVFNGEIYNFKEIQRGLEQVGVQLKTDSDTEVLLYLYANRGRACLHDLNGMFAFAIWDSRERQLFIARDRMGKKPLYYWETADHFIFASECKAFRGHPSFSPQIDFEALRHYFQYEYVPAPYSIYQGVRKLPAAHWIQVANKEVVMGPYWDIPLTGDKIEEDIPTIKRTIIDLLDRAVERRLVSDVPLGVFLSGGIDSSSIVALMARHLPGKDIKTFSIGFEESSFDESAQARRVSRIFGTDHDEQRLTGDRLFEILPEVVDKLDEPFADYSIFPTYLLSAFTRRKVTVALGGDGGDELFAGYPTFLADRIAKAYGLLPSILKGWINSLASCLPVSDRDMSFEFKLKQFLYGAYFPPIIRNQVWLGAFHYEEQEDLFVKGSQMDFQYERKPRNPLVLIEDILAGHRFKEWGDAILYFYQKFYLCDDILVKTDRASMAHSLEVRAPYLDVNLVEYVSRIPYLNKLKGRETKFALKEALKGVLPDDVIYRGKKGFGIPLALWLKGKLRQGMLATLNREKIKKEGIFDPERVESIVGEHLAGKKNHRKKIFSLLMFEWWRERFL